MNLRMFFPFALAALNTISVYAAEQKDSVEIIVENIWDKPKLNEPVVLKFKDLPIASDCSGVSVFSDTGEIPVQLDDLDSDSRYDELVFVSDIPAKSSRRFVIKVTQNKKEYASRVYAQMKLNDNKGNFPQISSMTVPGNTNTGHIYDALFHHGPAFESELVGYRIYFDHRQSIDLYGKKLKRLELGDTNFYTTPQQRSEGYGCDVLWAGTSVGLGAFRGWDGNNYVTIDSVETRTGSILSSGPLRSIIEYRDHNWKINGRNFDVVQRYAIYAGHRDVNVSINFSEDPDNMIFCTGIQKLEKNNTGFLSEGLAGSWGSNFPEKSDTIKNPLETLGLGIFVPHNYVCETKEDPSNYLMLLKSYNKAINYNIVFYSEKEEDGIRGSRNWFEYLDVWREELLHPCKIMIK